MDAVRSHELPLHAQKENLDATVSLTTPTRLRFSEVNKPASTKRAFGVHTEPKPKSKGLKVSASKERRVLGDISNQHRNRQLSPGTGLGASVKKQCVEPKDVKTPTTTKSALSQSITKPVVTKSHAEEIEEIESAYGGLSSLFPDADYMNALRKEMKDEIENDTTLTLIDDYDPSHVDTPWDDTEWERTMLSGDDRPSEWWGSSSGNDNRTLWVDSNSSLSSLDDEIPPPDDLPLFAVDEADDGLLEELLNVDVDQALASEADE